MQTSTPVSVRTTGSFSVDELSGDYSGPRYAFARKLGESAGAISSDDWREVQPLLEDLWVGVKIDLTFHEARPAIFLAWKSTKRLFGLPI